MLENSALVKSVQPLKASFPMVVISPRIVIDVRPVQPWKAELPILVTELGMVTLIRSVH